MFLLLLSATVPVFWQPLSALVGLASDGDRYTHILVVPFISGLTVYLERKKILSQARYAPKAGAFALALALILFRVLQPIPSRAATVRFSVVIASVVLTWAAGFLLCFGPQGSRAALFPLCFLLLMVPIPVDVLDKITLALQKASADMSYVLFKASGMPVFRQGFRFSLPGVEIEIAQECSGIRSSLALLMTSILSGYVFLRSWWTKGLLVLFTVPVVILKNSIRIVTISTLGVHVSRAFLYGNLHRRGGLLFALMAVLMLVPAIVALQRAERRVRLSPTIR